ncbi:MULTISPECIES: hypothetical protein [Pantoea]|jgi:hypothetical protein|nr:MULTISPECIES: hypothetical protein [Pantoea]
MSERPDDIDPLPGGNQVPGDDDYIPGDDEEAPEDSEFPEDDLPER